MSSAKVQQRDGESEQLIIDPFAFWPQCRSAISGLGGAVSSDDAHYAFHSPYMNCAEGPIEFAIDFENLKATSGTLAIRINALDKKPKSRAETVTVIQVPLADAARSPRPISVRVNCTGRHEYAILGHIYDKTDAEASGMTIWLERRSDVARFMQELTAGRQRVFGTAPVAGASSLISMDEPTLRDPVSQMCTAAQFDEPAYQQWCDRLRVNRHMHRKQWEFIYILQCLERYGALKEGAVGMGFGVGTEPLPAVMAAMGCKVLATDLPSEDTRSQAWNKTNQHGSSVEHLRRPDICSDEMLREHVSFLPVDMTRIPAELGEFDFTWSSCAYEHLGSIAAGLRFVEASIDCLRPGGVAVHTTEFNLTSNDHTVDHAGTVLFRRQDFERLAARLLAKGHFVAQFKYSTGTQPLDQHVDVPPYSSDNHLKLALSGYVTTSFGIVVRKGA